MQMIIIYGHGNKSYVEEDGLQPKMKAVCFQLWVHFNSLGVTWKKLHQCVLQDDRKEGMLIT